MKKVVIILCLFILTLPVLALAADEEPIYSKGDTGNEVYAIQQRLLDLGYLQYRPTGKYSDMTANAVKLFQQINGIEADGQVGSETNSALFSDRAKRNSASTVVKRTAGASYTGLITELGVLSDWSEINALLPVNSIFTVTDFNSGISFQMQRIGGINNAQVKTVSQKDYEAFLNAFGSETWDHRSVLVECSGTKYAASLFGMPTNNEASASSGNMNGYTELFFNNSSSDLFSLPDEEHNAAISRIAVANPVSETNEGEND